jgi:cellobiose transport system permease protein
MRTEPGTTILKTKVKPPLLTESRKESLAGYLYISPFFILFAIFGLFPILFSFYLAFQRWNGLNEMQFVGLRNFRLIFEDPLFWKSISNTFIMAIMSAIPQLILAFLLAFVLNSALVRAKSFFRIAFFMPNVTSIVAVALVFSSLFTNSPTGMINALLGVFGLEPINWNSSAWGIKIAISTMVMWRWVGYNTIIYLAGLQSIPQQLYEAAKIDGANTWQQIYYITLPLMRPVIMFTIFISTIGSLQLFTEPLVFIGRVMRDEGMTVVLYLYREAFVNHAFGTASATAVVLFFIIIAMSAINVSLANRIGNTQRRRG